MVSPGTGWGLGPSWGGARHPSHLNPPTHHCDVSVDLVAVQEDYSLATTVTRLNVFVFTGQYTVMTAICRPIQATNSATVLRSNTRMLLFTKVNFLNSNFVIVAILKSRSGHRHRSSRISLPSGS